MFKYILKRALALLVLYLIIILAIFALQFQSESVLTINAGPLRISLAETQTSDGTQTTLKNQFSTSYKGIVLSCSETEPVMCINTENSNIPLVLQSWQQVSPQICTLIFSEGIKLIFSVQGTAENEKFSVQAILPETVQAISLPFKPAGGFSIEQKSVPIKTDTDENTEEKNTEEQQLILFSSKNTVFSYSGPQLQDSVIHFDQQNTLAELVSYIPPEPEPEPPPPPEPEPEPVLSGWDDISSLSLASASTYRQVINQLEQSITQAATARTVSLQGEQTIVTTVAVMTRQGRQNQAFSLVPTNFKNDSKRTYVSAPFFGNIMQLDRTLTTADNTFENMIRTAVSRGSLDLFTSRTLVPYLLRQPLSGKTPLSVFSILSQQKTFAPDIFQAAGILFTYSELRRAGSAFADRMTDYLEHSLEIIKQSCSIENSRVVIKNNGQDIQLLEAAQIASALIQYGNATSIPQITVNGYAIINSYLPSVSQLDFNTWIALYNILVTDNPYMPRIQIISTDNEQPIWTWSCAANISYSKAANGDITMTVDYLPTGSHYMAIKNIEPFYRIEMYNLNYRSDPHFEIYDASGYVYDRQTKTLYLKVRHKTQKEVIRLIYSRSTPIPPGSMPSFQLAPDNATTDTTQNTTP